MAFFWEDYFPDLGADAGPSLPVPPAPEPPPLPVAGGSKGALVAVLGAAAFIYIVTR